MQTENLLGNEKISLATVVELGSWAEIENKSWDLLETIRRLGLLWKD